MTGRNRWGKAGIRLTEQQVEDRGRKAVAERNRSRMQRAADNRVTYRLWRAGELKPYLITLKLDAAGLYGPDVDTACGAAEPDVDLWEAGKLYPTWRQLLLLADLAGCTPRFLCIRMEPIPLDQTTLRFHGHTDDGPPTIWTFPPEVVAATVVGTPAKMPEAVDDADH